jgi:hypothetical protein
MKLRIIAWLGYKRGKGDIEDIEEILKTGMEAKSEENNAKT